MTINGISPFYFNIITLNDLCFGFRNGKNMLCVHFLKNSCQLITICIKMYEHQHDHTNNTQDMSFSVFTQ